MMVHTLNMLFQATWECIDMHEAAAHEGVKPVSNVISCPCVVPMMVLQSESQSDVVSKYIASLIKAYNLSALFKMASHCKFPLVEWLRQHRLKKSKINSF